jgi:hypothetical protein
LTPGANVLKLSGAPLCSRLLALSSNIRLGRKGLPGTNTSLLPQAVTYGCKKFYNIGPRWELLEISGSLNWMITMHEPWNYPTWETRYPRFKKPTIVQQKHLSSGLRYLLTSFHAKNISFSHFLFLVTFSHINHSCTFSLVYVLVLEVYFYTTQ